MNRLLIILLLFPCYLSAQQIYCSGSKENIEKLQVKIDSFHRANESNYQCEKWAYQYAGNNNWYIPVSYVAFKNIAINATCSTNKPVSSDNFKETSDGFYLIPVTASEDTVIIRRSGTGIPLVDKNGNHVKLNTVLNVNNFSVIPSFGQWCKINVIYVYNGKLYETLQGHYRTNNDPTVIPALFRYISNESPCPDWAQPVGAHDAYQIGSCVTFNGKKYESLINANVWSPTAYPAGWKLIQ